MNRKFSNYKNRKIPVREYSPNCWEEHQVWEIAQRVEDKDMRPLLKILRLHGLPVIESAFQEFLNLENMVNFTNKPGFFMYLIKKRLKGGELHND